MCASCAQTEYQEYQKDLRKNILLGAFLGVAWIIFFLSADTALSPPVIILEGIGFSFVPFGWKALSAITPRLFLLMPIVGWFVYFVLKLCLSILIGWLAALVQIIGTTKILHQIEYTEKWRDDMDISESEP